MLPSSIKNLKRFFISPPLATDIMFGRNHVEAVLCEQNQDQWCIKERFEKNMSVSLFSGNPTNDVTSALTIALKEITNKFSKQYLPIHISLPDAAARLMTFELDQCPKSSAEQLELVRWRFSQEFPQLLHTEKIVCASQNLSRAKNGKHLLLGMMMEKMWFDCVTQALRQADIVPWSLTTHACRQFDQFHDHLTANKQNGALVIFSPDYWSLLIWNSEGQLRLAFSRWHPALGIDYAEVIAEIMRLVASYVYGSKERIIENLFVITRHVENQRSEFLNILNSRLRKPCVLLTNVEAT